MTARRNVLLAGMGMTPQVLTNALYEFWIKRKKPIHLIEVLTTASGLARMEERGFLDPKKNPVEKLYSEYRLSSKKIPRPEFSRATVRIPGGMKSRNLDNKDDNEIMEEAIAERMRYWTAQDDVDLHVLLAGGRKTMSAYMILGMTVYARPQDELFHVLLNGPEAKINSIPNWFYPRVNKPKEANWTNLFEVPFPRLRNTIMRSRKDLLNKPLRKVFPALNEALEAPRLVVNFDDKQHLITINGQELDAAPRELWWLAIMAERKFRYKLCPTKPKAENCATCHKRGCALSAPSGDPDAEIDFDDRDMTILKRLAMGKGMFTDEEWVKSIRNAQNWRPVMSRLKKKIEEQFPDLAHYLDFQGKKVSRNDRRVYELPLDRERIMVLGNG